MLGSVFCAKVSAAVAKRRRAERVREAVERVVRSMLARLNYERRSCPMK